MEINEGSLRISSVSIQSAEYGMRAYINSARGRAQLTAECPPEIVTQVLAAWGPEPTVTEPVYPVSDLQPDPMATMRDDVDFLLIAELTREGLL